MGRSFVVQNARLPACFQLTNGCILLRPLNQPIMQAHFFGSHLCRPCQIELASIGLRFYKHLLRDDPSASCKLPTTLRQAQVRETLA
jgi:hypothetical protein